MSDPPDGASASPTREDDLFEWSATIFGPDETPWEGCQTRGFKHIGDF